MKIRVKKSKIHGIGVFAAKNIRKGEIIEKSPVILFNYKERKLINKTNLRNYYYIWSPRLFAISLGFGSIYNHSFIPNAEVFIEKDMLVFVSLRSIKNDEEIFINYDPFNKKNIWFKDLGKKKNIR